MTIEEVQEEIIDEFSMFEDWEERYEYMIDLGKSLPIIEERFKTEDNIIKGCQSKVWVHATMEDNKVNFKYADLTKLEEHEEWDLALSVDVMEHIEDDRTVFRHLYKGLKPGGILLISTPSDQGGSDVHHEHDESFIDEHVRDGYGVEEIDEKLREAGFENIQIKYSYGRPGKISWRLSMKYPILLANFSKIFLLVLPLYYLLVYPFCYFLNMADVRGTHSTGTGLIVKCKK